MMLACYYIDENHTFPKTLIQPLPRSTRCWPRPETFDSTKHPRSPPSEVALRSQGTTLIQLPRDTQHRVCSIDELSLPPKPRWTPSPTRRNATAVSNLLPWAKYGTVQSKYLQILGVPIPGSFHVAQPQLRLLSHSSCCTPAQLKVKSGKRFV